MVDMEVVRQFNSELSTIYETKPPISKGKVASITRLAVKGIKYYKHVVQSVEKFAQKCRQEYKVPALYIMDSIIRQSRHQFGPDKDVFGPRFLKSIHPTFQHIYKCPPEEQGRIVKVLNLWQKNGIFPPEVIQPLINMASQSNQNANQVSIQPSTAGPAQPVQELPDVATSAMTQMPQQAAAEVGQFPTMAGADPGSFISALQQQQLQQQQQQIELLRRQLEEQQHINQQQQQLLQRAPENEPLVPPQQHQQDPSSFHGTPQGVQQPGLSGAPEGEGDTPRFQLQPHVLAQIQALTGMNIRLPTAQNSNEPQDQGIPAPQYSGQMPNTPSLLGAAPQVGVIPQQPEGVPGKLYQEGGMGRGLLPTPGVPGQMVWDQQGLPGQPHPGQEDMAKKDPLDDFDYGDEQDDATRIAEQRRHLREEERRLSQT